MQVNVDEDHEPIKAADEKASADKKADYERRFGRISERMDAGYDRALGELKELGSFESAGKLDDEELRTARKREAKREATRSLRRRFESLEGTPSELAAKHARERAHKVEGKFRQVRPILQRHSPVPMGGKEPPARASADWFPRISVIGNWRRNAAGIGGAGLSNDLGQSPGSC